MNAPHTEFGKTKLCPVVTYTDGQLDTPPKESWNKTLWVERGEDEYALLNPDFARGTVRVVDRSVWLRCKEING